MKLFDAIAQAAGKEIEVASKVRFVYGNVGMKTGNGVYAAADVANTTMASKLKKAIRARFATSPYELKIVSAPVKNSTQGEYRVTVYLGPGRGKARQDTTKTGMTKYLRQRVNAAVEDVQKLSEKTSINSSGKKVAPKKVAPKKLPMQSKQGKAPRGTGKLKDFMKVNGLDASDLRAMLKFIAPAKEKAAEEVAAKVSVLGSVVVDGKTYEDDDIVKLAGKSIKSWKYAGSASDDENSIVVTINGKDKSFDGPNALQSALKLISPAKEKAADETAAKLPEYNKIVKTIANELVSIADSCAEETGRDSHEVALEVKNVFVSNKIQTDLPPKYIKKINSLAKRFNTAVADYTKKAKADYSDTLLAMQNAVMRATAK